MTTEDGSIDQEMDDTNSLALSSYLRIILFVDVHMQWRYNLIIIMLLVVAKNKNDRTNELTNLLTRDERSAGEHL